ncbi:MAG: hypothetical protein H0U51_06960 [Propionibacteriales bacterium]|nr:hypothetical protein [Propionibacteriales bacterium]
MLGVDTDVVGVDTDGVLGVEMEALEVGVVSGGPATLSGLQAESARQQTVPKIAVSVRPMTWPPEVEALKIGDSRSQRLPLRGNLWISRDA